LRPEIGVKETVRHQTCLRRDVEEPSRTPHHRLKQLLMDDSARSEGSCVVSEKSLIQLVEAERRVERGGGSRNLTERPNKGSNCIGDDTRDGDGCEDSEIAGRGAHGDQEEAKKRRVEA
jgi:hypothetical protein